MTNPNISQVPAPDMTGVKPGSAEEHQLYTEYKAAQKSITAEAHQRMADELADRVVSGNVVISPLDAQVTRQEVTGQHRAITPETE